MTSEIDIWRSANLLIERHGDEAPIQAAMRADELLEAGDTEGAATWRRIVRAVNELMSKAPEDGKVH